MSRNAYQSFGQPSLEELTLRFLAQRSDAAAVAAVESGESEVEPHEVAAGFRVDPRACWSDALAANPGALPPGSPPPAMPPHWSALVNQLAPCLAVPMAAGNFPQRVRDLEPLLEKFDPDELRPSRHHSPLPGYEGLRDWVRRHAADYPVLAGGLARLLGDLDTAARLLPADDENERAASMWQSGQCSEAYAAWTTAPSTPAVLFNHGMAALFTGRITEASDTLAEAAAAIPETTGWGALCRLYLSVAQIHR